MLSLLQLHPNPLMSPLPSSSSLSLSLSSSLQGYKGRANRVFSVAIQRVEKAMQNAYRGRKLKKRDARKGWIMQMNAGLRSYGVRYGEFIGMQTKTSVKLNRKVLANLAEMEPYSFKAVLDVTKMQAKGK